MLPLPSAALIEFRTQTIEQRKRPRQISGGVSSIYFVLPSLRKLEISPQPESPQLTQSVIQDQRN
jgi:hypothetical protein